MRRTAVGVSIFSASTESPHLQPHETTGTSDPSRLGAIEPPLGLTASNVRGSGGAVSLSPLQEPLVREKIHLPDVVLAHKMRDFEAKTSANSLLLDPLDNSLSRLSIDEKERVMLRMQAKIQQLTKDIDDRFVRLNDELNANVRERSAGAAKDTL